MTFKCAWGMVDLNPTRSTSGNYCPTYYRLRRRGVEGKQGKNRSTMAGAAALLCIAYGGSRPMAELTLEEQWKLVDSVCEYLYRLRPLCEWGAFKGGHQHLSPKAFLFEMLSTIDFYRSTNPQLIQEIRVWKRSIVHRAPLQQWLRSGLPQMAFCRAQLLTVGVSAIMHRIRSASPGRDFYWRVFLPGVIVSGVAGAQFRTPPSHQLFALQQYRPADSNRFSVRVARLESFFCSGRPTRIVVRFGSPDSNRVSIRGPRLESLFESGRPTRIVYRCGSPDSNRCDRQMRRLCVGFGRFLPIRSPPPIASDHDRPTATGCVAKWPRP